jgi:sporulation protein YlmC with PRC-barrel domain
MGITMSDLKGKNVYTSDARKIGEIVDFGFKIGELAPYLIVKTPSGKKLEIPWSEIAAARDIVLVKPSFNVPEDLLKVEQKICPYCGRPATWIEQYQRWYCYHCKRYID